jgi:hypothetical protein
VMQAVVAEIRVLDRGQIPPVFRVPILGPPYGLVHLALHNANPNPLVEGPRLVLAPVHGKVRRAGYHRTVDSLSTLHST